MNSETLYCDESIADTRSDFVLLREYSVLGGESAFCELVRRYAGLVYSAAFRQVRDTHLAEEVSQAVFLLLLRKTDSIKESTVMAGWLFRTTCYVAANARTMQKRRRHHESAAAEFYATEILPEESQTIWDELAPRLNEALLSLRATERNAILLRFFEGKSLDEISDVLGMTGEAARKRVSRGLEKLRTHFQAKGIAIPSAILAATLACHAAASAPAAAQAGFAQAVAHAQTSTNELLRQILNKLFWRKLLGSIAAIILIGAILATSFAAYRSRQTASAQSVQDTIIALDTAFASDPGQFVRLLHFRNVQHEGLRLVISNYVRSAIAFRAEFRGAFPDMTLRTRAWGLTMGEFFVGQSAVPLNPTGTSNTVVDFMAPRYRINLVRINGEWKWDFNLMSEAVADRKTELIEKTLLLEELTDEIRRGPRRTGEELLERFHSP